MDEITLPEDLLGVGFAPPQAEYLIAMVYQLMAEAGLVTEVQAGTGIAVTGTAVAPVVSLGAASIASLALADSAVQPGDLGTLASQDQINVPGDVNATGTPSNTTFLRGDGAWVAPPSGSGIVETVVAGTGVDVDATDPANPIVGLDGATQASLALADSATQPGDLGDLALLDTINNGNWSGTDLSVVNGGTGASTLTQYGVLIGNGTSAITASAVGTAGQVFTSNGPGVAPTFQTLSNSPGIVPLGSLVTASGSAAIDLIFSGSYREYIVKFWQLKPATDSVTFRLRTSSNGGSSFDSGASDYSYLGQTATDAAATIIVPFTNAEAYIQLVTGNTVGNAANEDGVSGEVRIYRPTTATYCNISGEMTYAAASGALAYSWVSGRRMAAADVDAVRLLFSSGNITSGSAQLYGVVTV